MIQNKTFGRKSGRMSGSEKEILSNVLPAVAIKSDTFFDFHGIFGRSALLFLEIGFGNGEFLYNLALHNPETDFVGIEVYMSGVAKLLRRLTGYEKSHSPYPQCIRIVNDDANAVLKNNFRDESLGGIYILFPDPWPKKRHHKRRLISSKSVGVMHRRLKKGGFVVVATDHDDYAEVIKETFASGSFRLTDTDLPEVRNTKYAQKAQLQGKSIHIFRFEKSPS